jgi:hypothetical protein
VNLPREARFYRERGIRLKYENWQGINTSNGSSQFFTI